MRLPALPRHQPEEATGSNGSARPTAHRQKANVANADAMSIGQIRRGVSNKTDTRSAQLGQSGESIWGPIASAPPIIEAR